MQELPKQILLTCLEESENGFILLNSAKQIIFCNHWLSSAAKLSREQILERTIEDVFPEIANSRVMAAIENALKSGIASVLSLYLKHSPFPLYGTVNGYEEIADLRQQIVIKPISSPNLPSHCMIQIGDVCNLMNHAGPLHDPVCQLKTQTQELQQAKQAAEMANRAKNSFLTGMAHKLDTPLNAIYGYTQLLERDKSLSCRQQDKINIIHRNSKYLSTLISDILVFSKIEAGSLKLEPSQVDFPYFFKEIVNLFRIRAEKKQISFIYQPLSHFSRFVVADEKRLWQIITNLLSNAVKFTQQGGVFLEIRDNEGKVHFQVEDTGIGIAPESLSKIFLPFKQVSDDKYRDDGTGLGLPSAGLGLSIAQKLVELMGGELHVESTVEHGSTFWFTLDLPVPTPVDMTLVEGPIIIGFQSDTKKILVVDDRWENRSVLIKLLGPLGFEVMEASNGKDAVDKACEWLPDLILMDLNMPVLDGYEATRQIRKIPALKNIVIIAVSADAFLNNQEKSMDGCNAFITKPIKADILLGHLQTLMNLTWIYEGQDNVDTTSSCELQTEVSLVGLSTKQATVLLNFAQLGDMNGIIAFSEQLEKTDEQLVPFARKIHRLAKDLRKKEIRELAERYTH
jgi:signal transduction histidine kinase/DNA-binding response OmpR family regulator